ncbi:hypothetical protein B0H14DRAFT_2681475 [Mycena olivaceomarginata]|nr:hypothetical protein B0H14DRAFT_2681475 [Mycena olivaceomarginata]
MLFSFHSWLAFTWMLTIAGSVAVFPISTSNSDAEGVHVGNGARYLLSQRVNFDEAEAAGTLLDAAAPYIGVAVTLILLGLLVLYVVLRHLHRPKATRRVEEKLEDKDSNNPSNDHLPEAERVV